MPTPYWTRSCIAYARLALRPSVWSPVIFPPRHMLISPAPVCCTSCILSLRVTALPCVLVGAHGSVRDLLRAEGLDEKVDGLDRTKTLDSLLRIVEGASC